MFLKVVNWNYYNNAISKISEKWRFLSEQKNDWSKNELAKAPLTKASVLWFNLEIGWKIKKNQNFEKNRNSCINVQASKEFKCWKKIWKQRFKMFQNKFFWQIVIFKWWTI